MSPSGKDMPVHRKLFVIVLVFITARIWSQGWEVAPASASGKISETLNLSFTGLGDAADLERYLIADEGWFWLRTIIDVDADDHNLLIHGSELSWTAWWNGERIASSGTPPPYWSPASPIPEWHEIPSGGSSGTLLMKAFVRRGYGRVPPQPLAGNPVTLRIHSFLASLETLLIPMLGLLLGILLFIGASAAHMSRRLPGDGSMALFGLFIALVSMEPILTFIPDLSRYINWSIPSLISLAAIPPAFSFWRRSVSNAGGRSPLIISILDLMAAVVVSLWLCFAAQGFDGPQMLPGFIYTFDPLPVYLIWSVALAVLLWILQTVKNREGRLGSLLILLAAITPMVYFYLKKTPGFRFTDIFITWSLAASLFVSLIFIMARSRRESPMPLKKSDTPAGERGIPVYEAEEEEVAEELELLEDDDSEVPGNRYAPSVIQPVPLQSADIKESIGEDHKSSLLIRSLRASMFPESMPWDPDWDLASARQGSSHPATGFHDVYRDSDGHLKGFAFMDTGSDSLESMVFAHLVQSELARIFPSGASLPRIARSVHRKAATAAGAAGRAMSGVIGRFRDSGPAFLPMAMPPLMLRRSDGRIISLEPAEIKAGNSPLGSENFGSNGLKTLSVSMTSGNILLIYTPSLIHLQSPSGNQLGLRGIAASLKSAEGPKADQVVAGIIGDLKDFTGKETLEVPLQVLVIRRR